MQMPSKKILISTKKSSSNFVHNVLKHVLRNFFFRFLTLCFHFSTDGDQTVCSGETCHVTTAMASYLEAPCQHISVPTLTAWNTSAPVAGEMYMCAQVSWATSLFWRAVILAVVELPSFTTQAITCVKCLCGLVCWFYAKEKCFFNNFLGFCSFSHLHYLGLCLLWRSLFSRSFLPVLFLSFYNFSLFLLSMFKLPVLVCKTSQRRLGLPGISEFCKFSKLA